MSTRSQRGRPVQKRKGASSQTIMYLVVGLIAIVGIALVAIRLLPGSQPTVTDVGSLDNFPSKGNPDAPVTVVEYADFQCPGCAAYANFTAPSIDRDYIETGKVRFVYHYFPLSQHLNAIPAAEAARCAADQGKFWEMHNLLFANQQQWAERADPTQQFLVYANELQLDNAAFEQCLTNHTYRAEIQAAQQAAVQAQIQATPTFVVNGQQYTSQNLREGIEKALAESAS